MNTDQPKQTTFTNTSVYNKKIYNKAKIPRVDNFMLKLSRNHFASTRSVLTNSLIHGTMYPNPIYFNKPLTSGWIPPKASLYLDEKRYIQDNKNIPLIYHAFQRAGSTKITYPPNLNDTISNSLCRSSIALPKRDIKDNHRRNLERYWWLNN